MVYIVIGGLNMKKDYEDQLFEESNFSLKRKANKETLEISSTGYGLEPVSKEMEGKENLEKDNR